MSNAPDEAAWLAALDYSAILDSAPDPMVLVDAQGVIRLVNQQAERVLGDTRDEFAATVGPR